MGVERLIYTSDDCSRILRMPQVKHVPPDASLDSCLDEIRGGDIGSSIVELLVHAQNKLDVRLYPQNVIDTV